MNNRLLSTLGLCKKAGKLLMGFDVTAGGIRDGSVRMLLTAADLSAKSTREIARIAEEKQIQTHTIPVPMDEIWYTLGKRSGILGVTDEGLAQLLDGMVDRAD